MRKRIERIRQWLDEHVANRRRAPITGVAVAPSNENGSAVMSFSSVSSAEISRNHSGTAVSPLLVLRGCSGVVLGSGAQRSIDSASGGFE